MIEILKMLDYLTLEDAALYLSDKIKKDIPRNRIVDLIQGGKLPFGVYIKHGWGTQYLPPPQLAPQKVRPLPETLPPQSYFLHTFYKVSMKHFGRLNFLLAEECFDVAFSVFEHPDGELFQFTDREHGVPVFEEPLIVPADLDSLADKMNEDRSECEITPKLKSNYLRTIDTLAIALIEGSGGEHHPDAAAVMVKLGKKYKLPVKEKALAAYLKEARDLA